MTDSNLLNKTKLLSCSTKGVLKLSFPLMISALATLFMIFVDRLFLAKYSIDTLNAAVNSGTLAWAFFGGMGMLTSMSEVFVAQYNGANDKKKIGSAVWQMIWVAIFSVFFFLPMAFWIAPIIYSNSIYASMQVDYFSTLMMFAPGYALMSALAGFFIGRGKTKLILILAVVANLINIILDKILIFGIDGVVPELGIKGAAIATCVGYLAQAIILLFIFLNSKNREKYKTNQFSFRKLAFLNALKIGAPQGVFYSLEILGWAIFFEMMTSISEFHITISAICQSIVILLSFFMDGLSKGVAAIAGNFIGAKRTIETTHILKSGFKLQVLFSSILLIFFMIDPNVTLPFFVNGQENTLLNSVESLKTLKTCFLYVLIYLTFEGFRWVISGLLSAAGDTIFLLIAGTTSVWLFLLSPIYFIVVKFKLPVETAWLLAVFYSLFSSFIYYMRYRGGKWKEIRLIQTTTDVIPTLENITSSQDENQ